jgi:hypothetical protein
VQLRHRCDANATAVDTSRATPYTPLITSLGSFQAPYINTEVVKIRPIAGSILCSPTAMFTSVREHRGANALLDARRLTKAPPQGEATTFETASGCALTHPYELIRGNPECQRSNS